MVLATWLLGINLTCSYMASDQAENQGPWASYLVYYLSSHIVHIIGLHCDEKGVKPLFYTICPSFLYNLFLDFFRMH